MQWAKRGNTHTDATYSGNQDFVKNVTLKDHTIAAEIEKHRRAVFEIYPRTSRSKEQYADFMNRLWSAWVREKKKNAVRMVSEVRRRPRESNSTNVSDPAHQIPNPITQAIPRSGPSDPSSPNNVLHHSATTPFGTIACLHGISIPPFAFFIDCKN